MAGVCWKLGLLLEDSIQGGQDFAGGCSELYISLCKNDGVVCACAVCVTGSVDWFWSVCAPHTLERKRYFNIYGYCYSVCNEEAHVFAIHRLYSVTGWQDFLRDGLLLEDMVPG